MARHVVGLATMAAVAGGTVGVWAAGAATAAPVSRTLQYNCSIQSITQPATVTVDADVPKSAVVGKPTPQFAIRAGAPVSAAVTSGLNFIGVKSFEGTVEAKARVEAPQGDAPVRLQFQVPRTRVPASGPFRAKATGTAPSRTFRQPGKAKISVGDLVLHIVPRDASGRVYPRRADVPCTLKPGQKTVVASFEITRPKAPTGSGATRPNTSGGTASASDDSAHSTASGSAGSSPGAKSADPARGSAQQTADRATGGATDGASAHGPTAAAEHTAAAGIQDTTILIPLTVGALVAGAIGLAVAFRFRSRGR
ncbi:MULTISPECIES: DUF6801 domain-containing protein [Streptomyces]|uniref:DUF6801 domain-containing protein n=1 Tax=Streptomyces TaxID=1883 RepID=UPI003434B367